MFPLILCYLILTIIRPQDYMPGLVGVPLLSVVLVLAFLFWLGSSAKTFEAPQFLILPMFMLAIMVSAVVNGGTGGVVEQTVSFAPVVVAFFVLAAGVAVSPRRVSMVFAIFVLCAAVLALHGVDQIANGVGWTGAGLSEQSRIQYVGIFSDPNDLGLLFVACMPMAVFLSSRGGFFGRLFWLAGAGLLLYGVYLTNSRGAMLAVLVVGGGYIWYRRGPVTAGVLSFVGLLGMKLLSSRMQELDVDESSAFGRVDAWYEGMHMFTSHPMFGIGAGSFTDHNDLTAHNSFILVLAETGLFGYIPWFAFMAYGFWMMAAVLRHRMDTQASAMVVADLTRDRAIALTLLLSLSGMFAAAFFLSRSYTILLYLVAAVVVGHYVGMRRRVPELPSFALGDGWWRWIPIALASIITLAIVVQILMHSS